MQPKSIFTLWQSRFLLLMSGLLLLSFLGTKELWTQEHRWFEIVANMFDRQDFFHPILDSKPYYDKPLLSYWLMAMFAFIFGKLNLWALRLPSALAGIFSVWTLYQLGKKVSDKTTGLVSAWLLLTSFYFVFWAKTSSADMLNMAGSLFAVYWYFEKREQTNFVNYAIFFTILAVTSLCKGLVGAVVPVLIILPDLIRAQQWKKHLNPRFFLSMLPAVTIYLLPFLLSTFFGSAEYKQNGLYLVYRENILRYFQPFDHKDPIYVYFFYLPVYLLPWTVFLIPALLSVPKKWGNFSAGLKSISIGMLLLFLFFTLSGSRRNYYILPMVPFCFLIIARWFEDNFNKETLEKMLLAVLAVFLIIYLVITPLYYGSNQLQTFATKLTHEAEKTKPLPNWNVVLLDPESKIQFYLQLPKQSKKYGMDRNIRYQHTMQNLLDAWPMKETDPKSTVFVSRETYEPELRKLFPNHLVIKTKQRKLDRLLKIKNPDAPIAFIPL